jgi:hypothetical protein
MTLNAEGHQAMPQPELGGDLGGLEHVHNHQSEVLLRPQFMHRILPWNFVQSGISVKIKCLFFYFFGLQLFEVPLGVPEEAEMLWRVSYPVP